MRQLTFNQRYARSLEQNGTRLCIGLDSDIENLPECVRGASNPVLEFNRQIIEATSDFCCAYKPNFAFYERDGVRGIEALAKTLEYIPEGIITIADAKRGDIGNTAERYATSILDELGFDAVTISPYLGLDSMEPYFARSGVCVFVLGLTSNPGSFDFQRMDVNGAPFYSSVIEKCVNQYGTTGKLGFVVGATHPGELGEIRGALGADIPLLIPGIGAQGGDVEATVGANNGGIAFVNVSRGIIKAGSGDDFAMKAREAALRFVEELARTDPDTRVQVPAGV